jgi:hypothetical protein
MVDFSHFLSGNKERQFPPHFVGRAGDFFGDATHFLSRRAGPCYNTHGGAALLRDAGGRPLKAILATTILLFSAIAAIAAPLGANGPAAPEPTTATGMLAACVATLPHEPITLNGVIAVRKQRGIIVAEHPYRLALNWGATPSRVVCDLLDDAGVTQERVTITRAPGQPAALELRTGPELTPQPMPDLTTPVAGTDITWLDLTLDFLWWRDARLEGQDSVLEHACDVIVVKPPRPLPGCHGVRLYLEHKMHVLMRAEEIDAQGNVIRKMSIRSVKQFKERWLIREMEIATAEDFFRTRLRVDDVSSP